MPPHDEAGLETLLAANAAFYIAFATGDLEAMQAIWSEGSDVCCTHPGQQALQGPAAVLSSWFDILAAPPPVQLANPRGFVLQDGIGMVLCIEQIGEAHVAATNLFRFEDGAWRMIHHHGGQIFGPPPSRSDAAEH